MQRVCVIGLGPIGNRHAGIYRDHPLAELVGVCDILPDRAEAAAARARAEKAVELEPEAWDSREALGVALALAGTLPEAEAALREAIELGGADPSMSAQAALAYTLCLQGSLDDARPVLAGIDSGLPGAVPDMHELYFAGQAHARLGNAARARGLFAEATRRWPKHPWSTEMRAWLATDP
jgi:tetratricopeptide (TPR) repeat protein